MLCSKWKKNSTTYFPSGVDASVHSFITLPSNFHGNLHSAFLSGLSSVLVVRHLGPKNFVGSNKSKKLKN